MQTLHERKFSPHSNILELGGKGGKSGSEAAVQPWGGNCMRNMHLIIRVHQSR